MLSLEKLKADVENGAIDTVLLVLTDMPGRLQGKRLDARYFLDEILAHGAEGCAYLLAVDVEMRTVSGYAMSSWETGYGDFVMKPDLSTLRLIPWLEKTAMVQADLQWQDGKEVAPSPRQVLKKQLARLEERGLEAFAATELEFILFRETYETAFKKRYWDLEAANQYNVDYSIIGTSRVENVIGRLRREMAGAGLIVENSKGECNFGQHEVNFKYKSALATADDHVVFKTGAKEIASQEGHAITFMAKYNEREGNSCHIHFSLRRKDGSALFRDDPKAFEHFLAGQLAYVRELTLFYAPNINSYKRYAVGSFAPTAVAWGRDNRTCGFRVVGHGAGLRVENRIPGADVNPYLALSAMIAAGLYGMDQKLPLEPEFSGNAYHSSKPRVPSSLRVARELFAASALAKEAFGEAVVAHYLNSADVELEAFESAVTDWERIRGFERL
ncbi:MAG: glutamine synthetase family protein [Deinococcus sp.]|nr:glutamine synthetase family protein [Deinococcus sp.]